MTDRDVVGIFFESAHDDEVRVGQFALDDGEGAKERQDVLDGHDAHDRADRDRPLVIEKLGNGREALHAHAVRHDRDLFRIAAEVSGDLAVVLEERVEAIGAVIRKACEIVEVANPHALEVRLRPVALQDFRLAFA